MRIYRVVKRKDGWHQEHRSQLFHGMWSNLWKDDKNLILIHKDEAINLAKMTARIDSMTFGHTHYQLKKDTYIIYQKGVEVPYKTNLNL